MLGLMLDAEGLDAAEGHSECFHLDQDVFEFEIKLLDLAASVDALRFLEARLDHGDGRRSDICPLAFFKVVEVEKFCS